jgi:lactoylglutathione lyase
MRLAYTTLYVEDVQSTLTFYEKAFDAKVHYIIKDKKKIVNAKIATGATVIVLQDAKQAQIPFPGNFTPLQPSQTPMSIGLTFLVMRGEVEDTYQKAVAAGAKPVQEPKIEPNGDEIAYVQDPNGVVVGIMKAVDAELRFDQLKCG